jgi:antitoxin ChpS
MVAFKTRARAPHGKAARKTGGRVTPAKATKTAKTGKTAKLDGWAGPKQFAADVKRVQVKRVVVRKVGGSLMAAVPADVVRDMGLAEGQTLALAYDGGRMVLEPAAALAPVRYTLGEILASCNLDLPPTGEEREWENAPRIGREAL